MSRSEAKKQCEQKKLPKIWMVIMYVGYCLIPGNTLGIISNLINFKVSVQFKKKICKGTKSKDKTLNGIRTKLLSHNYKTAKAYPLTDKALKNLCVVHVSRFTST